MAAVGNWKVTGAYPKERMQCKYNMDSNRGRHLHSPLHCPVNLWLISDYCLHLASLE